MNNLLNSKSIILGATALLVASVTAPLAQVEAPPYRINCGGDAFTDMQGNNWEADGHFNGGMLFSTTEPISGTEDDILYQTERWLDDNVGPLNYNFVVPNGAYFVRLHMSEIYSNWQAVGARVFSIAINGPLVLDQYDIYAEVGGNTATIKEFPVAVTTGEIVISLSNIVQHAKIDGIEVLDASTVSTHKQAKLQDRFTIKTTGSSVSISAEPTSSYSVVLRDIRGSKLSQKTGIGSSVLHFNNLQPGVYFLEAQSGKELVTKKVCILR